MFDVPNRVRLKAFYAAICQLLPAGSKLLPVLRSLAKDGSDD
jgi:hypothetical protein